MTSNDTSKIPVTIITGFLGSGKTTLLNYLVKQPDMKLTAIIINEFGEIGIDHLLVETSSEQIIEMNNGCICCNIRGDLQDKLGSLAMWLDTGRIAPVERVIVETTGLADPAPIMHTLMTDEHLLNRYRLSGVVTVVDSISGSSSLSRFQEAVKQIAIADQLIFSKTDLVESLSDQDSYLAFKARVKQVNSRAVVHEAVNGEIDLSILLRQEIDGTEAILADFSGWLGSAAAAPIETDNYVQMHRHDQSCSGIETFTVELDRPVAREEFNEFIQALAIEFGEHLLRMKGILNVADRSEQPAIVHGVQHVFFPIMWLDKWPSEERTSKLVFITQGLAPEIIQARFDERLNFDEHASIPS
jgi:G3E family GTPase